MLSPVLPVRDAAAESLQWAHPVVREWFLRRFGTPTEPQEQGWPDILRGKPTLISAPTGSGKTLAAFLIAIDGLLRKAIEGRLGATTEVVYISPLKALSNDVQKNLETPLREIQELALERGYLCPPIRTAVRTGDTLPAERRAMLNQPPHILVTTPESLYILLTSEKSRQNLREVRTVIVDEIHAVADDKRGSHLTLTLERLDALVRGENPLSAADFVSGHEAPQRIGLSATQNPIELVADFLAGQYAGEVEIVQAGQRRAMDLRIEVPADELGAVATQTIWDGIHARLAELALQHRSTLVFVNTRRMVERLAFALGERLGEENVAAHHGSLSHKLRHEAEWKLKSGKIRILIATASLELGIDIGTVDLVCQINTPRAIATAMQRIGRAGHWRGAVPKGIFFATTRDDLMENAALIRAMRRGVLDRLEVPAKPIDVLMQQIVATCATEPWEERQLFEVFRRALPYRDLTWEEFDEALRLLTDGIESSRGRYGAYLLRDRVHGRIQARRGARLAAVMNGGTIPETSLLPVIMQPDGVQIAALDEDFAVEASAGDIVLLGSTSWRIQRVESTGGRVLVEDAHGQPPTVPFWTGEAPQRTQELSEFISELREELDRRTRDVLPGYISQTNPQVAETVAWLKQECAVDESAAEQIIGYVVAGRAVLGTVPTVTTIVAERFFDEGGGMQLILHAPFGGRINKAWGLALRKRFCRGFNFELQAAATDNGLNISLAEQHSFPLSDVFQFLTTQTVTELLEQASLASPIFKSRWRWAANRSLQLLRFQKGRKVAPQIQRTRSDDLLASVFPQVAACQENVEGDIQIPDHPLVREVMKDVLGEAMDLEGLKAVLAAMDDGRIRCVAVDTTIPSVFSHELLNANPYAYLDDAPLEERRARAVAMRGVLPDKELGEAARLSPAAILEIREQIWPDPRDEHELHDLFCSLVIVPADIASDRRAAEWGEWYARLDQQGRVTTASVQGREYFVAAECVEDLRLLWPHMLCPTAVGRIPANHKDSDSVLRKAIQGWMALLGPVTSLGLGERLGIPPREIWKQMLSLEVSGTILRGVFEAAPNSGPIGDENVEWCERRLLQRIHKRTLHALRQQIEPVTPAVYMRFVLNWQHLGTQRQLTGEQGLLEAIRGLAGFEAPAAEWERSLFPQRVANYDPRWLDTLTLTGAVGWGRISPHPAFGSIESGGPKRIIPTRMAPITFFIREEALWMDLCLSQRQIPEMHLAVSLSELANQLRSYLGERGAMFPGDIARLLSAPAEDVSRALWELVAAGLVTADGFDSLRMLVDPRRKQMFAVPARARATQKHNGAGRWSLLCAANPVHETAGAAAARREAQVESACMVLLCRYGVVFYDLMARETAMPRWRELLGMFRRLEARGLVRGGRFVSGFGGEQFALPEALESLRQVRNRKADVQPVTFAAADPMNLIGIVIPGERQASMPGRTVRYPAPTLTENSVEPEGVARDLFAIVPTPLEDSALA
ncbi:MAG: DEAD/DEAH box helicase [Acidobacteriaceae bacterium]|nr:DEAD/DEAH box helicase [Acidobacteriaceae bacterium]